MTQRSRDFLILIAVAVAVFGGAELILQLEAWDETHTCLSLGRRDCGQTIYPRDLRLPVPPEDGARIAGPR